MLADHIGGLASAVMGLPPSEILDPAAGFFQLGMDSLMSVTLSRSLSASLGESCTPAVVFDYPNVESLTDHLATVLPELRRWPVAAWPTSTTTSRKRICCNNFPSRLGRPN